MRKFEARARARRAERASDRRALHAVHPARRVAASTPWGAPACGRTRACSSLFHNETWGGEKVFQLLSKLAENSPANRDLLELIYIVLALGFEGRYRVIDDGKAQLESLRERLAQMLAATRADGARRSRRAGGRSGQDGPPGRRYADVGRASPQALVLFGVYLGLRLSHQRSAPIPVFAELQGLDVKAAPPRHRRRPCPRPRRGSPTFLKPEIDAGLVQVRDLVDRSIVIDQGRRLLRAGQRRSISTRPAAADAHRRRPAGDAGHGARHRAHRQPADPVAALPFELASVAGAGDGREDAAASVKPERIRAEGRADAEPVETNATPAGRRAIAASRSPSCFRRPHEHRQRLELHAVPRPA